MWVGSARKARLSSHEKQYNQSKGRKVSRPIMTLRGRCHLMVVVIMTRRSDAVQMTFDKFPHSEVAGWMDGLTQTVDFATGGHCSFYAFNLEFRQFFKDCNYDHPLTLTPMIIIVAMMTKVA